jgi:hypothetical protein
MVELLYVYSSYDAPDGVPVPEGKKTGDRDRNKVKGRRKKAKGKRKGKAEGKLWDSGGPA